MYQRQFARKVHIRAAPPALSWCSFPPALLLVTTLLLLVPELHRAPFAAILSPNPPAPHPSASAAAPSTTHDGDLSAAARRARPLPRCAVGRARSFLMVFMGHSASTSMIVELRQHRLLHIEAGELVDHQVRFNTSEALQITRSFFTRAMRFHKTPGFKIRPNHILTKPADFAALVRRFDTRIIWNYRQNVFKAAIAEYGVRYHNHSAAIEGLRRNLSHVDRCKRALCRFRIHHMPLLHAILKEKVRSHHLISLAVSVLARDGCVREVPYEDYLYDREGVLRDLQRFLGVPYERVRQERFKATGDNLCEVVQNWDELCQHFYPCLAWQHMLDDPRNGCFCRYRGGAKARFCEAAFDVPRL